MKLKVILPRDEKNQPVKSTPVPYKQVQDGIFYHEAYSANSPKLKDRQTVVYYSHCSDGFYTSQAYRDENYEVYLYPSGTVIELVL